MLKNDRHGEFQRVVPANAGTHTARTLVWALEQRPFSLLRPGVMGPCVRTRACTHLVRRIDSGLARGIPESGVRVISIATLRLGRGVDMLAQINWSLGRFGDRRLDKGGRRSSNAWSRAVMSACGGWPKATAPRKCGSTASSAMPR